MDYGLALWGAVTLLSILGGLHLAEMVEEFHHRGLERIRKGTR